MHGEARDLSFGAVIGEATRLAEVDAGLRARGIGLGRWRAASRHAAVFEVAAYGGAAPAVPMVAKLPWLLAAPVSDHPDEIATGAGPAVVRLVSATGPYALDGAPTEDEAARLIATPAAHQRDLGVAAPLPELIELVEVAGRPVAIHVDVRGHDLAWMLACWPGRARRLLPRLARTVLTLHARYGPHGDLKPEHVLTDFDGAGPLTLLDPLGPLTGGMVGSIGWQLPLPIGALPVLADVAALAQLVGACWNDPLPWDGRLAYGLCNLHNGRFASGVSPTRLRAELAEAMPRVPAPWREWALTVADAMYAAWEEDGDARGRTERWLRERLEALAVMPPWVGDDRG